MPQPRNKQQEQVKEQEQDDVGIIIDGQAVYFKDLTYGERRMVRTTARELADNEDLENATADDYEIAFAYIVAKRSNPDVTVNEILGLKPAEVSTSEGAVPPSEPSSKRRPAKAS